MPQSSKKQGASNSTTNNSNQNSSSSGAKDSFTTSKAIKLQNQRNNMIIPQGLMFLPDGKALIMDADLFNHTLQHSIVIDLVDSSRFGGDSIDCEDGQINSLDDPKVSRNNHKEINRKPSQANQKRQGKGLSGDGLNFGSLQDPTLNEILDSANANGLHCIQEESSTVPSSLISPDHLASHHSDNRNFLSLINQPQFSDVTLLVEGRQIYAH